MKRQIFAFCFLPFLCLTCTDRVRTVDLFPRVEKLLMTAPDSALFLLQRISAEECGNRADRARYALLYAEAADRSGVKENCDSMLLLAWDYYREQPREIRNLCRTLYCQGRSKLRQGDKPAALRLFLEIEEKLIHLDEPYYLGLLYLRIGEVYRSELNFVRAYRYDREAYNLFLRSKDTRRMVEALLGMTFSALRMRDLESAQHDCSLAFELANEWQDESLLKRCLGYFATLNVLSDTVLISDSLLQRMEFLFHDDTTASGRCTMAQIHLLRHDLDSARLYIKIAENRVSTTEEWPLLLYTAFRIDIQAGRYQEATQNIHRFIFLNDSLTRTAMQISAGMIEKEYFRERAAFSDYKMKNREMWELVVAGGVLLVLGIAGYLIRQQIRLHKERKERYWWLVQEMQCKYRELVAVIQQKCHTEIRLKGVIASRFDIVNRLGKTLYERENTALGQTAIVRQVKQLVDSFAENGEMLQELEQIVNMAHDNAMQKLKNDFPNMKDADMRLLCYIFGGFSPQVISLFMRDSVANIYARKSRLKARIKASDSPNKELFLTLLG